jgi:cell division protein FtsW
MTALPAATLPRRTIDFPLFGATLALVVIGLLMVLDSSYARTLDDHRVGFDAFFFVKRQAVGAIVGICVMFTMMRIGYWRLREWAFPMMMTGLILLCAVYLPHIGVRENNASRWLALGPIKFQPSEFAKLALLVYMSKLLSRPWPKEKRKQSKLIEWLGPPLSVTALYLILIEREPDLGTAAVLFLAILTQLYLAGTRKRHILMLLGGTLLAVFLMGFVFKHRGDRITAFLHPERDPQGIGFQITHSVRAVGSGSWFGMGLGKGCEKYFLPQVNSDFIFATVAEELGFVGIVPILGLLFVAGWRGFQIAGQTKDRFGSLLAAGLAALISWQALINIGVATASIPATGVPLPFISYGSSSLVLLMASIGILLNIAQYPTPPGQPVTAQKS